MRGFALLFAALVLLLIRPAADFCFAEEHSHELANREHHHEEHHNKKHRKNVHKKLKKAKESREAELDQMLAPIALYPDSLLAQVLIAATFPDQVVEADGWVKGNPDIKGDALNDALDRKEWDLSVKELARFPQVLDMMAKESAWTQRLGEAFLAQESDVLASIQRLRSKGQAAGSMKGGRHNAGMAPRRPSKTSW
jgi:hypothetical protein